MTTAEYFGPARPHSQLARPSAGSFINHAVKSVVRWRRMRRALGELKQLDDRMLKDIGLSRSTLYDSARAVHGFADQGHGRG